MVTPIRGNDGSDGVKPESGNWQTGASASTLAPVCAADVGPKRFIKTLKDFEKQRTARVRELTAEIGDLTINRLIGKRPDDLFTASEALRLADGDFLRDSPFFYVTDMTSAVTGRLIEEIGREPERFWLVPVELRLV